MNYRLDILCCCAAATMLAAACDDSEADFDLRFTTTGDVTLLASIENCTTRASLVGTGEARWEREDAIAVICTDGTAVRFALDGTGETRRALFTGTIPEGRQLGSWALHPASARMTGDLLTATLPATAEPAAAGSCSVMAAPVEGSAQIAFRQLVSYLTLQIGNVDSDAAQLELTSDKRLSGEFSARLPEALQTGIAAEPGEEADGVIISLPERHDATVTITLPVPAGEYGSLVLKAYDSTGAEIGRTECLTGSIRAERGEMRSIAAVLPSRSAREPIEGTVLVAGIYWALGNLQHVEGEGDEEFQTDWRIAPAQWHYVNCEQAGAPGQAVTFAPDSYSQCDHFNWGGIANPFDNAAESSAAAAVGTDIAGMLYTSQDCTSATGEFDAARFGDIAYWASKGRFRMPTSAEFQKLLDEASSRYGCYEIADGRFVTGILFTDPEEGQSPVHDETEATFTDEDLAKGLFLPKAGRRYTAQPLTVNVQGTQGTYWTSECTTGQGATEPCYATILHIVSAGFTYPYWNKAFDAKAGFLVRPVYIEKR